MFNLDQSTKIIGLFTAVIALVGGGYTGLDKINSSLKDKAILIWSPEHFNISNGPADGDFQVYVARKKLRDDCKVVDFTLEVRDSKFNVYHVTPSISVFSGPAGPDIEKFGYKFKIDNNQDVSKGEATLLAHIGYSCPEGAVMVNYPKHPNLNFIIN